MTKKALITGITGQDGSYLAELLLSKGYEVHGLRRRSSSPNTGRINHILNEAETSDGELFVHYGDMADSSNLIRLVQDIEPDEIYNLAAQSHVKVSFETPEYTGNVDGIGLLRCLEAIRLLGFEDHTRLYQASTSEMYGNSVDGLQGENTPFNPVSPYGAAKLYGYWTTVSYRNAYNIHASNGILFNHESPRRDRTFVTRKISLSVANIAKGTQDKIHLGNLDAKRDWGFAPEYVEAMWLMLQQNTPDDYVIATSQTHSVREFVIEAFKAIDIEIEWSGRGVNEVGVNVSTGREMICIDPWFFRPNEINTLRGDYQKAKTALGWEPSTTFAKLVNIMVNADMKQTDY